MVMRLPAGFLVQSMSDFNVGVDPMQTLGHQWIDVLKMDIEGSEYKSLGFLANLPGDAMRFTQLQLELHQQWAPDPSKPNVAQFDLLRSMLGHGYRTTFLEPNIYFAAQTCHELAFIKMDECGNVITPVKQEN
jgi:Methyltransferase FkbM domain